MFQKKFVCLKLDLMLLLSVFYIPVMRPFLIADHIVLILKLFFNDSRKEEHHNLLKALKTTNIIGCFCQSNTQPNGG